MKLPTKAHQHYNKFKDWTKNKSIRLIKRYGKYFIEVFFETKKPELKEKGKVVGLDCGYKELLVSSENKSYDLGLEDIYEKISRKKQGSHSFKRSLIERDNLVNHSLNQMDLTELKEIVCEDLKNVKKGSKVKNRGQVSY